MPTLAEYYDYSILATAAYVDLATVNKANGRAIAEAANIEERIPGALAEVTFNPVANPGQVWTISQAKFINAAEEQEAVTGYFGNDETGFAATLFERNGTKVLAIRGTEPTTKIDIWKDLIVADLGQIGFLGLALSQAVSMINLMLRLRAPAAAQTVVQFAWNVSITKPAVVASSPLGGGLAYLSLVPSNTGKGLGLLGDTEKITVTGHSLGGHLAALAARLFPGMVKDAYLFNAPGFDPTTSNVLTFLPGMLVVRKVIGNLTLQFTEPFIKLIGPYLPVEPATSFSALTLYNLESEDLALGNDQSVVSSVFTGSPVLGTETLITTEANSHLIEPLMDSLALHALLFSMNASLTEKQITRLYETASRDIAGTQEGLVEALYKLFTGDAVKLARVDVERDQPISGAAGIGAGNIAGRRDYYDKLIKLEAEIKSNAAATLYSLTEISSTELRSRALAVNGLAYRYALEELNPFAVLGPDSLYARHNADGTLDLYDPDLPSSAGMTTSYLADRIAMLAWKIKDYSADGQSVLKGDAVETYKYIDKTLKGPAGLDLTFTVLGTQTNSVSIPAFVVFGSEAGETLSGGDVAVGDHLYGRGGDDNLQGMGGDDYLEGNAGIDTLIGGSGDDVLLGGPGFDTYLYETGDGFDTILDSDGSGEIKYNERVLTGGSKISEGFYEDAFGVEYLFSGDAGDYGLLLINDEILVENFHSGMFGLVFDGEPESPSRPESAPVNVYSGSDLPTGFDSGDYNDLLRVSHGSGVDDLFLVSDQMSGVVGRSSNDAAILDGNPYGLDVDMGSGDDYIDASESSGSVFAARLSGGGGSDYILGGTGKDNIWGDSHLVVHRSNASSYLTIIDGFIYNAGQSAGTGLLGGLEAGQGAFSAPFRDLTSLYGFEVEDADTLLSDGAFFDGSLEGAIENVLGKEGDFDDFIDAGAGDDFVVGGSGADRIFGGGGSDSIWGDYGGGPLDAPTYPRLVTLLGPLSQLFGRPGDDVVDGGSGDDFLYDADGGDDVLIGGEGDDVIVSTESFWTPANGRGARNVIHGDMGDDSIEVHNATGGLDFVDGGDGNDSIRVYASRYFFYDEESDTEVAGEVDGRAFVFGGSGDDILVVNADDGVVDGGTGDDDYTVSGHSIIISDPSGNDTLHLSILFDHASLDGFLEAALTGSEEDFASQSLSFFVVRNGSDLVASMRTRLAGELVDSSEIRIRDWFEGTTFPLENLTVSDGAGGEVSLDPHLLETWGGFHVGGSGADELFEATDCTDHSFGRGGNDLIATGEGSDRIYGGAGNDELHGGAGDDLYFYAVGDGDDLISDESGFDELRLGPGISVSDVTASVHETGIAVTAGFGKIEVVGGSRSDPGIEQIRFSDGTTILVTSLLPGEIVEMEPPAPDGVRIITLGSADSAPEEGGEVAGEAQRSVSPVALAEKVEHPVPSDQATFDLPAFHFGTEQAIRGGDTNRPPGDFLDPARSALGARETGGAALPDLQTMLDAIQAFDASSPTGSGPGSVASVRSAPLAGEHEGDPRAGSALTSLALTNALLMFHLEQSDARGVADGAAEWFQQTDAFAGIGVASGLSSFGPSSFGRQAPGLATFAGLQEGFTRLA